MREVLEEMQRHATILNTQSLSDTSRFAPSQVATILRNYILKLQIIEDNKNDAVTTTLPEEIHST